MVAKHLDLKMLVRAFGLGLLAGLSGAIGYLLLTVIYMVMGHSGTTVYLGGSSQVVNGQAQVVLPPFVFYVSLLGMGGWGVLLARVITISERPVWWKVAPLMWVATGLMLLGSYLFAPQFDKFYAILVPGVGFVLFGLLFGLALDSFKAALILAVATPATYIIAVLLKLIFPVTFTTAVLTGYPPTHTAFLQTSEALKQALTWVLHGGAMGIAVCFVDDRMRERYDIMRKGL